ncbi:MAG TPA: quinohemoprotein amine dehydrogenase maturation protein [Vicinamibacterales bacterium]|nr:quinohemoprotein amine dehydrogenase maturation protein [Vicinamibacterales bacterium]
MYAAREHHRFEAAGKPFVYLVPSAAIFELDEASDAALRALTERPLSREELEPYGSALDDLMRVQAIGIVDEPRPPQQKIIPLAPFPLTTMVLNVTNQCNLSCTYCYEYGEDKIVDTENGRQPKFMSEETARDSVEFMLKEAGTNPVAHITFFGGETLLNFPVLKTTIAYARQRAAEVGKTVDFSLTTNATLLKPEIIEFLAENRVGVTISIDGPKEVQDRFRVFNNGTGSYDIVAPKIKELIKRHRTRPIGARVTLTSGKMDVKRIYRHLTEEIGFWEVGFAPVTTAPNRAHAIAEGGYDEMLGQFTELADEFLEASVANRHHGFSNVKETIEELHKGVSKAYPCGAGLGLLGVATDGDVALCHRFAGSDTHKLGTVRDGIDRSAQFAFYEKHHVYNKTDCSVCWARPLCSGGCYHEAHTRYGDTAHANLHYCDWIRGWTDVCLRVYGELSVRNPAYLSQFDEPEREALAERVS